MVSPGGGAGTKATSVAGLKGIIESLVRQLPHFEVGSKEFTSVDSAIRTLNRVFGKSSGSDMVPAALKQMIGGKPPLAGAPPPGMAGAPPAMPQAAAAMGGMAGGPE